MKLGAARINSIDDDVKNAREAKAIWAVKRDAELAANPWSFATTRASIPATSTAPAFGFGYAYPLPADYLAMVEVGQFWAMYEPSDGGPWFAIEGDEILTDEGSPLRIRYVRRIENAGLFPALFVEALACRLAAELAEPLTQSLQKRQAAWREHAQAVSLARRRNAIERPPQRTVDDSWTIARRS